MTKNTSANGLRWTKYVIWKDIPKEKDQKSTEVNVQAKALGGGIRAKKACCGPGPLWQDGGEGGRKNGMHPSQQGYQNQIIQIHCLDMSLGTFSKMGGLGRCGQVAKMKTT